MSEFYSRTAHKTPTIFSDDTRTPFDDLAIDRLGDEEYVRNFFKGKTVLDIGSGYEGIARRLFAMFGNSDEAPRVINLNPQFSDWRMLDFDENGKRVNCRLYKQDEIAQGIHLKMHTSGENSSGYFDQRIAAAGLAQQLPIASGSIDIVTSTWGFPNVFYDCGGSTRDHQAGYREVERILSPGGVALLAPIDESERPHAERILEKTLDSSTGFVLQRTSEYLGGFNYLINIVKAE